MIEQIRTIELELKRCRPWIEAALHEGLGTHEFDDVVASIRAGSFQLWPASRACVVTEITAYPRKTVLNVFLGGGSMQQILEMEDSIAAWGRAQGCDAMTVEGRKGWSRVLGWKHAGTTLVREL